MEVSTYISERDLSRLERNCPEQTNFMIIFAGSPVDPSVGCLQVIADLPRSKQETYFLLIPGRSWHCQEVAQVLLGDS